jgi:hypothetical protein
VIGGIKMNRRFFILFSVLLTALFFGCGTTLKEINAKSLSTRTGIFVDAEGHEPVPAGYSVLDITVLVKTALAGHYILESKQSLFRKPELSFIFNIDGQGVIWKADGQKEVTPAYDEKEMRIADGGKGMGYILHREIRLTPGPHRVFLGYPPDERSREFDILLKEGISRLEIKPIYRKRGKRPPSFVNGLSDFEVFYNGDIIPHDSR